MPLQGSRFALSLMGLFGWRVVCRGLPAAQGVMIVYPHTSNWDFPLAVMSKWATGMPLTWWVKPSLFRWPLFGRWLRALGARPVERSARQGAVAQMAGALARAKADGEFLWLGLSPEGTRGLTPGWRSGFYRIALQAGVPVGLALFDFGRREVRFEQFWQLGGDAVADLNALALACEGTSGFNPGDAAPVRLMETRDD